MARRPRHTKVGEPYEMVFRAREGIPFPCNDYMNLIIFGLLAKCLSRQGITLCHFVFVGNHPHLLLVPHCKSKLRHFHSQIKSSLTRVVKRVTGMETNENLQLWDGRSTLMQILDIDKAIERIVYLYSNPAKANLVESIKEYPGVSSWDAYSEVKDTLDAQLVVECPYIPEKRISPLNNKTPETYEEELQTLVQKKIPLVLKPNLWMKSFGIAADQDVANINQQILERLRGNEKTIRDERKLRDKKVISRRELINQAPTTSGWKPKTKERRIHFLSSCKEMRIEFIEYYESFCNKCRQVYEEWKKGTPPINWPSEAYLPQPP